jgi:hypothetical protein
VAEGGGVSLVLDPRTRFLHNPSSPDALLRKVRATRSAARC